MPRCTGDIDHALIFYHLVVSARLVLAFAHNIRYVVRLNCHHGGETQWHMILFWWDWALDRSDFSHFGPDREPHWVEWIHFGPRSLQSGPGTGRSAPCRSAHVRPKRGRSAPTSGTIRPKFWVVPPQHPSHKPKYTLIRNKLFNSAHRRRLVNSVWHSNFNKPTWFPPFPFYCLYLALSTLVELVLHVWRSSSSDPHFIVSVITRILDPPHVRVTMP